MDVFLAISNKCLELAHFPRPWKTAHVYILRNPGTEDYTIPKSYRPMGLLPVLGKVREKLLVHRLRWYLLPTLSTRQYGFITQQLACAARVSWGLSPAIIRTIYVAVIEPIVLYAANVWGPAASKLSIRKKLDWLQ